MTINWDQLEQDVGSWARKNFGDQPKENPFIGTAEEFAELTEYLLTNPSDEVTDEELDAIGDIVIFFADYCARSNISYKEAASKRNEIDLQTNCENIETLCVEITISRGNQAYSLLKQKQGIRENRDGVGRGADVISLAHTLKAIETFANNRGYTLEDAIEEAWGEVKNREWDSSYN